MIGNIFLENFQGFAEGVQIPLKPLTLIFGPNSSGKSAIIRSIRFSQQSMALVDGVGSNNFVSKGTSVDIGSFQTAVNRHDSSKTIKFGISIDFKGPSNIRIQRVLFEIGDQMQCRNVTFFGISQIKGTEEPFKIKLTRTSKTFNTSQFVRLTSTVASNDLGLSELWTLDSPSKKVVENLDSALLMDLFEKFRTHKKIYRGLATPTEENIDEIRASITGAKWTMDNFRPRRHYSDLEIRQLGSDKLDLLLFIQVRGQLTDYLLSKAIDHLRVSLAGRNMAFVGPLRTVPDRVTFISGSKVSVSADGSDIASALAANPKTRERISEWLLAATQGTYELDYVPFEGEAQAIFGDAGALVLRDCKVGTNVAFSDAGTGLSQILPILEKMVHFEALLLQQSQIDAEHGNSRVTSASGTILLIEQPELHLHPKMQSDLMGLFVNHVHYGKGATQIIAETHSESMVLRLQREIQNGTIDPEDISVIYVEKDRDTGDSRVTPLPLSKSGQFLTDWPESFSDLRFAELGA